MTNDLSLCHYYGDMTNDLSLCQEFGANLDADGIEADNCKQANHHDETEKPCRGNP